MKTASATLAAIWCLGCGNESASPRLDTVPDTQQSGDMLWAVSGTSNGRVASDPLTVFYPGTDHHIAAVSKRTGKLTWKSATPMGGGHTLGAGATVAGSVVVFADGFLFAFDRSTGAHKWTFAGEEGDIPGQSVPAADASQVYSGSGSGRVFALDAETGALVWRQEPPVTYQALALDPTVEGDQVFVGLAAVNGRRGALVAFDARLGTVLWSHDFTPYVTGLQLARCTGNAVTDSSTVYAWFERGDVVALDRATGTLKWHRPPAVLHNGTDRRQLALVDEVLVVGSSVDGHLEGLDPETGNMMWSLALSPGSILDPLANDDDTVYVITAGGALAAVVARSGMLKWSYGLNAISNPGLTGTPLVDADTVYAGGTMGLYAFLK